MYRNFANQRLPRAVHVRTPLRPTDTMIVGSECVHRSDVYRTCVARTMGTCSCVSFHMSRLSLSKLPSALFAFPKGHWPVSFGSCTHALADQKSLSCAPLRQTRRPAGGLARQRGLRRASRTETPILIVIFFMLQLSSDSLTLIAMTYVTITVPYLHNVFVVVPQA